MSTPTVRMVRSCNWRVACVFAAAATMALALEGCMTLGESVPPPPGSTPPPEIALNAPPQETPAPIPEPKPVPKKPPRPIRAEPAPRAEPEAHAAQPAMDLKTLIGLDQARVRAILGPPQRVKSDHLSLTWIYKAPQCSAQVIFYPSLEDASFHVLKFAGSNKDGRPLDVSDACVSHILVARSNAH